MHWTTKEIEFILQNKDLSLDTLKDDMFYNTGIERSKHSIKKKLWSMSNNERISYSIIKGVCKPKNMCFRCSVSVQRKYTDIIKNLIDAIHHKEHTSESVDFDAIFEKIKEKI